MWKQWENEFHSYLAAKRGCNDIPLSYVICMDKDIEEEAFQALEGPSRDVYMAPLQGVHVERDNFQVFQYLCTLLRSGTADTYIDEYEVQGDGRGTWVQLLICYEGDDAKNAAIAATCKTICTMTWDHNMRNFTFDDFCNHHIKANNELKN